MLQSGTLAGDDVAVVASHSLIRHIISSLSMCTDDSPLSQCVEILGELMMGACEQLHITTGDVYWRNVVPRKIFSYAELLN